MERFRSDPLLCRAEEVTGLPKTLIVAVALTLLFPLLFGGPGTTGRACDLVCAVIPAVHTARALESSTPHADESGDLVAELVEQMQRSTTSEEHELAHAMAAGLLASVQTIEEVPS